MYRSAEYMGWLSKCELIIKSANIEPVKGKYKLWVRAVRPDKRRRDIDNIGSKAINDLLQKVGIVEDDCLCESVLSEWVKSGPETHITIFPIGGSNELPDGTSRTLQSGEEAFEQERDPPLSPREALAAAYAEARSRTKGGRGKKAGVDFRKI